MILEWRLSMDLRFLTFWFWSLIALLSPSAVFSGTNLIAYIDGEGDLYLIQPEGNGRRKLASGEVLQTIVFSPQRVKNGRDFYSWPVWSPDGNHLACFRVVGGEAESTDELYIFDARNSQVLHAYQEAGLRPIYAYWAPNSQNIAVLLGGQEALSLGLWPIAGSQRPKTVAQGAPFYFHWRIDGRALLVHSGGDSEAKRGHSVSVVDIDSGKRIVVSRDPAAFGPPSWSSDGKWLAYGNQSKGIEKADLIIAAADGSAPKSFGTLPEKIALEWSPTQPVLAVATSTFVGDPLLEELKIIDIPSGKTRTVVKDHFAAYFWSPDGERILYAKRKLGSDLWAWAVADVKAGKTYEIVDFVPSRPLLLVFQYFDQYALSHRLWSPDGKHFVFAGAAGPGVRPAEGLHNPTVYIADAVEHAKAKVLAQGHIAFWSPQ
jgi:TolB protein